MKLTVFVNEKKHIVQILPDTTLFELLRNLGYLSVKRGCGTSNCGLCTVWLEGQPVLSCSVLAPRVNEKHITTLEGVSEEMQELTKFFAAEGAEQCGYCSPGLLMTVLAMKRELQHPTESEIKAYLSGNLCRCTGYMSQMRAIQRYMEATS